MRKIIPIVFIGLVTMGLALPVGAAPKTTTLTFWTFQELHNQFWVDAVTTWNHDHPDNRIVLKMEVYNYDEMHNKLLVALQSGVGAPDMADIEISKFANFLKGKQPELVPLNSIVNPVLKHCFKARFDNYAKDGNYYGVDYHVGATVMYYNKEYLAKAGVDADAIVTWDDYVAAGKKVVAATGKPMTTIEVTEHWSVYPLISQIGSDIFSKDGQVILDNARNVKVLTFLYDMIYRDKIAIPAPGGFHHCEEYWSFMNKGGAASLMMPMWYMGRFVQYMPGLKGKMIIRPLPVWTKGGKRSAGMGGTGTVITAQSRNQAVALQLLAQAKLSKTGSMKTWTLLGFDPVRFDVWTDPAMGSANQFTAYFGRDIFTILTRIKDEINPIVVTEKYPLAIDLLKRDIVFKVLKEQSKTPAEALGEASARLRKP